MILESTGTTFGTAPEWIMTLFAVCAAVMSVGAKREAQLLLNKTVTQHGAMLQNHTKKLGEHDVSIAQHKVEIENIKVRIQPLMPR